MSQNKTPETVSIPVPENMTVEQFQKLIEKTKKLDDAAQIQKKRDKAVYQALTKLRDDHKDEYKKHVIAFCKKENVEPPKTMS